MHSGGSDSAIVARMTDLWADAQSVEEDQGASAGKKKTHSKDRQEIHCSCHSKTLCQYSCAQWSLYWVDSAWFLQFWKLIWFTNSKVYCFQDQYFVQHSAVASKMFATEECLQTFFFNYFFPVFPWLEFIMINKVALKLVFSSYSKHIAWFYRWYFSGSLPLCLNTKRPECSLNWELTGCGAREPVNGAGDPYPAGQRCRNFTIRIWDVLFF